MKTDDYALLTDLYQLTMAQGYWECDKLNEQACFYMFFRENPFHGGYAVACGMAHLAEILEKLTFTEEDIAYLASLEAPGGGKLFNPGFLDYLLNMKFDVDVMAVREGTVVFPNDPLVRVTGSILQCQLLETALLNCVNFETLVATKAARVCREAGSPVAVLRVKRAASMLHALPLWAAVLQHLTCLRADCLTFLFRVRTLIPGLCHLKQSWRRFALMHASCLRTACCLLIPMTLRKVSKTPSPLVLK